MIALEEMSKNSFQNHSDAIMRIEKAAFSSPWTLNAFRDEIRNPFSIILALCIEVTTVGYICFWVVRGEVHLMNIAVDPFMRRRGYGSILLDEMISRSISRGAEEIWLEVRPSNNGAIGLYKKVGFREIGRRPGYYSDTKEDAILMCMTIMKGAAIDKCDLLKDIVAPQAAEN